MLVWISHTFVVDTVEAAIVEGVNGRRPIGWWMADRMRCVDWWCFGVMVVGGGGTLRFGCGRCVIMWTECEV